MKNKFLEIKKCENHNYFYAERLGKDSVAFILYDEDTRMFGLILEYKPPIDSFLLTAFGGSLGKAFVSTQMNQFCHLFIVNTTNAEQGKPRPENNIESKASVIWVSRKDIISGDCWKAATILLRSGL